MLERAVFRYLLVLSGCSSCVFLFYFSPYLFIYRSKGKEPGGYLHEVGPSVSSQIMICIMSSGMNNESFFEQLKLWQGKNLTLLKICVCVCFPLGQKTGRKAFEASSADRISPRGRLDVSGRPRPKSHDQPVPELSNYFNRQITPEKGKKGALSGITDVWSRLF